MGNRKVLLFLVSLFYVAFNWMEKFENFAKMKKKKKKEWPLYFTR